MMYMNGRKYGLMVRVSQSFFITFYAWYSSEQILEWTSASATMKIIIMSLSGKRPR